jgi:hypothetical protein
MFLFPFIFSTTATIIFWLGLSIFSDVNYEVTFLVSQAALYTTIPLFPVEELKEYNAGFFIHGPRTLRNAVIIVIMTVIISVINLYVYKDQILVSLEDLFVQRIYELLSYTFLPFAQLGGWLYQSLMVYFLAVVFGTTCRFRHYLSFVGMAYTGFLISTLLSLIMNLLSYDLSIIEQNVIMRYSIGKFGEAFSMILLAFFIYYNEEKFTLIRCCFIACFPTVVIIIFQILL